MTVLSLSLAGLLYICMWTDPKSSKSVFSIQNHSCPQSKNSLVEPKDKLEVALRKASMPNKTLIITVVNKAYVLPNKDRYPSMLDLFLESFWVGEDTRQLLDHLLIVALDQAAYDRCKFRRLHCYKLVNDDHEDVNIAGEKMFNSTGFIKMMWGRTSFLLDVLMHGYNFIFTDADILWIRNPFTRLNKEPNEDLQISTDWFVGETRSENYINTGFYHIKSNNKTISLFEKWYGEKDNSKGLKEQDVLADLMHKGAVKELGLRVRFLDTLYFSCFCHESNDVKVINTVHGNCCRSISAKVIDLSQVLNDWDKFKKSTKDEQRKSFQWNRHNACQDSWKKPQKA